MAKKPTEMTEAELAEEMQKRPDSLDHLIARAEMERRRTRYMLWSTIAAAISAIAAMVAAIVSSVRGCG